jgi:ketosteroid isomerase-like protein
MTTIDDTKGPRENLHAWLSAFKAKDIERLCSLYDSDSLYANAHAPLARGIPGIRPRYENAFARVAARPRQQHCRRRKFLVSRGSHRRTLAPGRPIKLSDQIVHYTS